MGEEVNREDKEMTLVLLDTHEGYLQLEPGSSPLLSGQSKSSLHR